MGGSAIHHGDCLDVMAQLPEASVSAVVTDPPYGIGFMGHEWDQPGRFAAVRKGPGLTPGHPREREARRFVGDHCKTTARATSMEAGRYDYGIDAMRRYQGWCEAWGDAALRVTEPGGYLLSFCGTRTVHRLAAGLEDAGWLIRDMLVWGYAQGFPKSRALLKPAWEPIVMARKPGPLRELDIEGCRIDGGPRPLIVSESEPSVTTYGDGLNGSRAAGKTTAGRWPANIVLTDPIFDGGMEGVEGGGETSSGSAHVLRRAGIGYGSNAQGGEAMDATYGDAGTYSRFFLIPKASRSDREPVMPGMLEERVVKTQGRAEGRTVNADGTITVHGDTRQPRRNQHPTVKPVELMRHLVRLVTPAGGTVLDPFLGSGTTALAAEQEGRAWVGIEREAEYVAIAEARLAGWQQGLGLAVPA